MSMEVAGKTAIVTGAGSGISLAFAKQLLEKGCNVVIGDIALRPEAQDVVNVYTRGKGSPKAGAIFQQTDVADWAQLERLFDMAIKEFGGIDIVCPGAGVFEPPWSNFWYPPGHPKSRDDASQSRYATLDININHPIRATQLAIDYFVTEKKPGVVVHVSSTSGQRAFFATPLYVASKHAISGFIRSLASLEFPVGPVPKIRVNGVAPGIIKTPLWTDNKEKLQIMDEAKDEWATPEEVAEIMIELIEKEENIGGTILEVGKNHTRRVEQFNDPGPSGRGVNVSNIGALIQDVWSQLVERVSR